MAENLHIEKPATAAQPRPDMEAFLSLGFRPLYIAGCAWALISIAIWIFAPGWTAAPISGVIWHAHEMLWGFVATIAVAFLLTASATWTGFNPLKGRWLAVISVLWVVARAGYLIGGDIATHIACGSELAFFVISATCLMRVMVKGKSRRNYGVPLLVLGLGLAHGLFIMAALDGDYALLMKRFDLGLVCMAMVALLIGRRVIPFFSMRMVPGLEIPMQVRNGQVQLAISVLALALGLAGQDTAMAVALAMVGIISLYQIARWRPLSVLHKPLLWILYLGYAALGVGLLFAAVHASGLGTGVLARSAVHVHIVGMGGFAVLIIGMVTRTALGHLGRPLVLDQSMLASYGLIIAAVALRLGALWPSAFSVWLLQAAALCWIAGFALYLWRFIPLLIRPRYTPPANPAATSASVKLNVKAKA